MRIELANTYDFVKVAELLNKIVGDINEGKTWFWSHDTSTLKEEVEIFTYCSPRVIQTLTKLMNYTEYEPMNLPCGGTAYFDEGSGISYRCECGSVVGSIGQPQSCKDEEAKWDSWSSLGGKGWDYFAGKTK